MARKLRKKEGRKIYAKRKPIVEPVFGQTKEARGLRRFLLRDRLLVADVAACLAQLISTGFTLRCYRRSGNGREGGANGPSARHFLNSG
jgi:hypothetical protein